ncbi:oxidative stress induced growth inhibitor family member 2 [Rhinolophus ferrumequinum]|uniref:Oxidative stress induced growth inhibitor family member 2 n=2 Tax=Rhinolophus ferrumequinum TaxID=59479 RepID=A0A7J7VEK6_RHIFE|nr:oxidative stress-induced growth inhibitor 2 isoform X1 [Rhinolophus ferrumequinum]KAF6323559.1 oxidative stress induced growth inhibitor family member 2 [Rhinolophus ferrumequinum]
MPVWCCRCSLPGHFRCCNFYKLTARPSTSKNISTRLIARLALWPWSGSERAMSPRNYRDTETEGEIFNSLVQYFGDNLGRKVKAMPLVEETSLLEDSSVTLPMVVIGNGPSGICLSYMLSGYRPYLSPEAIHPNAILHSKLEEARHLSIVDQDLEYLSEGLEGRSSNPVAVLFDTLLHPGADFGHDEPSVLHWKLEQHHYIPHVVLGKGPPGGAWHNMEGSMLTISFGNWMELPGLKFKDWASSKRRNLKGDRVVPEEVARYYKHYVKVMGLQKNFRENTHITSVSRLYRDHDDDDGGQDSSISAQQLQINKSKFIRRNWEVRGYQRIADGSQVPFCLFAENVALATGTLDSPAHLEVEGEDFPFVFHSMPEFGAAVSRGKLRGRVDPVLIVGSGLTAADAVLCAYNNNIPVIHVFRRRVTDPSLIFKQLPKKLYPEYHKVYHMMCTQSCSADSNLLSDYTSFPEHHVLSFKSDMKCILQSVSGLKKIFKLSAAVVLIGSHPNLSFLKEQGCYLGHNSSQPITCKGNPVEIDAYTYECVKEAHLFALGPLVGDNFVRFLKGGALGVTHCLAARKKKQHLFVERGGGDGIA